MSGASDKRMVFKAHDGRSPNLTERFASRPSRGFTLVEVVVSIVITGIVVGFVAMFMTVPVDAYIDQSERAVLNDSSQTVSRWLGSDLRAALPNSVRISNVGNRAIVEMLRVESMSFYRPNGTLAGALNRELDFSGAPDMQFSTFGRVDGTATVFPYGVVGFFVIGHRGTGVPSYDAYQLNNVITPTNNFQITLLPGGEESVTLPSPGFSFTAPGDSRNRIFWVSGPVTYICNSAARTLRRFSGYPVTASIANTENDAQLIGAGVIDTLLATNVASCRLRCSSGLAIDSLCQDTLVVEISVDRVTPPVNEVIRLFEHFPIDNSI